jgi:predicted NAD-dependent protein-ADP-ribosyltransferase YbiA (DUF1768 family)
VVFLQAKDAWGRLSDMAGQMALNIGGVTVRTSERLFQAHRFPAHSHIQQAVLHQLSPMIVKHVAHKKELGAVARPDWEQANIDLMRWCMRVKLAHHPRQFGQELMLTGHRPIVERAARATGGLSRLGRTAERERLLYGMNLIRKLLVELRAGGAGERIRSYGSGAAASLWDLVLLGQPVGTLSSGLPAVRSRAETATGDRTPGRAWQHGLSMRASYFPRFAGEIVVVT